MFTTRNFLGAVCGVMFGLAVMLPVALAQETQPDPLPSWNDTGPKAAIFDFVERVTTQGSADFVPENERIAVFDNDGTLWVEQPMYTQLAFAIDRVKQEASVHPEWSEMQPFKAALEDDMETLSTLGEKGLVELVTATHGEMSVEKFQQIVSDWLATARHPRFNRPYTELVYQPMLELLAYLRANGFKTFIVSGGSVEFMRPWAEQVYGVPPYQIVGSSTKTEFEKRDGLPMLFRTWQVNFINDGPGKPVGINEQIGLRPIAAFGNSDGDLEMLQWTTMAQRRRLGLIVHHTDADREYAYDRDASFGRLDKALDAAEINQWIVVDMKKDWKVIFPFELK